MHVPSQFEHELQNAFHGKFRLRWSDKRQEFHLEQKVFTGQVIPPPVDNDNNFDTYDDSYIRAKEGYFLVMVIRTGDRMPCPVCGATLSVPVMETREVKCQRCLEHGLDARYIAAYYPLNHVLIDHIRDIDPENGGPIRAGKRLRARQIERDQRQRKSDMDDADFGVLENQEFLESRPWVGFGGNKSRNVMDW